jgi:hypothetical protein
LGKTQNLKGMQLSLFWLPLNVPLF